MVFHGKQSNFKRMPLPQEYILEKKKWGWDLPEISLLNSRNFWAENPLLFHGIRPWPLSRTSHREHIWRSFSVVKSCESRSCSGKHRDLIVQLPVFHILNNSARVWNYFLYEFTEKTRFIYDFCETCRSQMTKPWFYHDVWYLLRKKNNCGQKWFLTNHGWSMILRESSSCNLFFDVFWRIFNSLPWTGNVQSIGTSPKFLAIK